MRYQPPRRPLLAGVTVPGVAADAGMLLARARRSSPTMLSVFWTCVDQYVGGQPLPLEPGAICRLGQIALPEGEVNAAQAEFDFSPPADLSTCDVGGQYVLARAETQPAIEVCPRISELDSSDRTDQRKRRPIHNVNNQLEPERHVNSHVSNVLLTTREDPI